MMGRCAILGCAATPTARGICHRHYGRCADWLRRHHGRAARSWTAEHWDAARAAITAALTGDVARQVEHLAAWDDLAALLGYDPGLVPLDRLVAEVAELLSSLRDAVGAGDGERIADVIDRVAELQPARMSEQNARGTG